MTNSQIRGTNNTGRQIFSDAPFTWPQGTVHSVGGYRGACAIFSLSDGEVRRLLPLGLSLAPQTLTEPGTHPVAVLLGWQRHVRLNVWPGRGAGYLECVIAVPFVQRDDGSLPYRGPFAYLRRLYLTSPLYTVLGWLYGFPKRWSRVHGNASEYRVCGLVEDRPLVWARFSDYGCSRSISEVPEFEPSATIWRQPFIQTYPLGCFVCSVQNFELDRGSVRPVALQLELCDGLGLGLPAGETEFPRLSSTAPLGTYLLDVQWTLSLPMRCRSLKPRQ